MLDISFLFFFCDIEFFLNFNLNVKGPVRFLARLGLFFFTRKNVC